MQKFKFLKDKPTQENSATPPQENGKKSKAKRNNKTEDVANHDTMSMLSEQRRLISRSAIVSSSGKDKYNYDSERANLPVRHVEQQLDRNLLSPNYMYERSISQMSGSSNSSDFRCNRSTVSVGRESVASTVKRESVVRTFEIQNSVFENGRFQNPFPNYKPPAFTNILKLGLSNDRGSVSSKQELNLSLPLLIPNIQKPPPPNIFRLTWIGHSTVLAEFDNISVLTDPIFSQRASPSQAFGPKRYRDPPCTIHDLPSTLDAVVISHSHYDHLDLSTVMLLNARYGNDLRWFIPMGLADWFSRVGCENVVELDWWEENCVPDKSDVSFVFTPTQHWSKRTLSDDNRSLWGSWVVKGPQYKFFFAGDTGYCNVFKTIGTIHGPFDVAAIPIGAYEPRCSMRCQHVNPEEAVRIHRDLKCRFSLGIHWGTFAMSNEHYLDPQKKLKDAVVHNRLHEKEFVTFMHGETRIINPDRTVETTPRNRIY